MKNFEIENEVENIIEMSFLENYTSDKDNQKKRDYRSIELSKIPDIMHISIDWSKNPRTTYSETHVIELMDSIRFTKGNLNPLTVVLEDGKFYLKQGYTRALALRKLFELGEILPVECKIISNTEWDERDNYIINLELNKQRPLTGMELAKAAKKLIEEYGFSATEASKKTGLNYVTVLNYMKMFEVGGETLVKEVEDNHMSISTAVEIAKEVEKSGEDINEVVTELKDFYKKANPKKAEKNEGKITSNTIKLSKHSKKERLEEDAEEEEIVKSEIKEKEEIKRVNEQKPDTNLIGNFVIYLEEFLEEIMGEKYSLNFKYGISTEQGEQFAKKLFDNGINFCWSKLK